MPLVDLAIIHGGQGSVQTAIASGTPFLGFPLHPEQDFNLNLVENKGGGLRLSLKSLKNRDFRPHIEEMLNNLSYKSRMKRLKGLQDSYGGGENAAAALIELAIENGPK